eukprot:SAG22_NODE_1136_length_5395_cov_2.101189_6_plen_369_part_00
MYLRRPENTWRDACRGRRRLHPGWLWLSRRGKQPRLFSRLQPGPPVRTLGRPRGRAPGVVFRRRTSRRTVPKWLPKRRPKRRMNTICQPHPSASAMPCAMPMARTGSPSPTTHDHQLGLYLQREEHDRWLHEEHQQQLHEDHQLGLYLQREEHGRFLHEKHQQQLQHQQLQLQPGPGAAVRRVLSKNTWQRSSKRSCSARKTQPPTPQILTNRSGSSYSTTSRRSTGAGAGQACGRGVGAGGGRGHNVAEITKQTNGQPKAAGKTNEELRTRRAQANAGWQKQRRTEPRKRRLGAGAPRAPLPGRCEQVSSLPIRSEFANDATPRLDTACPSGAAACPREGQALPVCVCVCVCVCARCVLCVVCVCVW